MTSFLQRQFSPARRRRLITSVLAGVITLAAYAVYAVTIVPFVEKEAPDTRADNAFRPQGPSAGSSTGDRRFAEWFPEADAWEQANPLVIETPQAILVFREYHNIRGGVVRLTPCSVVMLQSDHGGSVEQQMREAIVLRAPEGANLQFDRELQLNRGEVGNLIGGDLLGPVTIRGAGKKPTPDDDLFLATRDIMMHGDLISTTEDVEFRWGDNYGQGRNLNIALLPVDDGQRDASRFGGMATLELRENVQMHLALSNDEVDEAAAGENSADAADGPSLFGPTNPAGSTQPPTVADNSAADNADNPFPFSRDTPLEIMCGKEFRFNFLDLQASFNGGFLAWRPLPNGTRDQLKGDRLVIGFRELLDDENAEEGESDTPVAQRAFARMEVKSLEATGNGDDQLAILDAPSRQAYAHGDKLAYNFLTGGVTLESRDEIRFRHETNEMRARDLEYEPGEDGKIGAFLANGPGWLDWEMRGDDQQESRRFRAAWKSRLHSRPIEGLQIISVEEDAVVAVTGMGRIAARQIHAWVLEKMPRPGEVFPEGEEPKPELLPQRMLAVENVNFFSEQLTGRTERLEAWFVDENAPSNSGAIAAAQPTFRRDGLGDRSLGLSSKARGEWRFAGYRGDARFGQPLQSSSPQARPAVQLVSFQSGGQRRLPWSSASTSSASTSSASADSTDAQVSAGSPTTVRADNVPWTAIAEGSQQPGSTRGGSTRLIPIGQSGQSGGDRLPTGSRGGVGDRSGSIPPILGPVVPASPSRQFDMQGQTIRVLLVQQEKTADVTQVTVKGGAMLRETRTEKPDDLPLFIRGDVLHVEEAHLPSSRMTVAGEPAHVEGRGLGLTANRINLDRGRNQMWIDEPGKMTLLIDRDLQGQQLRERVPLEITWRRRMDFDGLRAVFDRGVVASRETEQLQTEMLEVVMSEYVDFSSATEDEGQRGQQNRDRRPEIARVICREGVYMEARRYDNHGELEAIEQLQIADLAIDQQSGAMSGSGPGWIKRVGKSDASVEFGLPGSVPPPAAGPVRRDDKDKIVYLRVDFQQGMTGNIHRKQVIFQRQVECVYGPVGGWDETIDPSHPSRFEGRTVVVHSDELTVTEMPAVGTQPAWRELVASGNTTAEGQDFIAYADRITYTEDKQHLILNGNSVQPAELYFQRRIGDDAARVAARKVIYKRTTGEVSVEGASSADLTIPRRRDGGGRR